LGLCVGTWNKVKDSPNRARRLCSNPKSSPSCRTFASFDVVALGFPSRTIVGFPMPVLRRSSRLQWDDPRGGMVSHLTVQLIRVVLGFPVHVGSPSSWWDLTTSMLGSSWRHGRPRSCRPCLFAGGCYSPAWESPFALVWPPFALSLGCLPCRLARSFGVRPFTLALGCSRRLWAGGVIARPVVLS